MALLPLYLKNLNPFWRDVYKAWNNPVLTEVENEHQKEILFHNHLIKIDNEPVYFRDWYLKGISHLNDIIDEQGKLYTWESFSNKFNIENQAFKDLVTPNISACRKIDNTLLIKALFISWKRSN
jgi:hypothetical protein